MTIFLATGLTQRQVDANGRRAHRNPLVHAARSSRALIESGKIIDAKTMIGYCRYRKRLSAAARKKANIA